MSEDLTTAEYWDQEWTEGIAVRGSWLWNIYRNPGWFRSLCSEWMDHSGLEKQRILEIGCAPGHMLQLLTRLRGQHEFSGIDYSPEGLAKTRSMFQQQNIAADFYLTDMESAELPHLYDLVVSYGLIEHFVDPAEALRYHARLCEPGGYVAVAVPNYASPVVKSLIQRFDPEALETHYLDIMNPISMRAAFESAGLANVEVGTRGGPRVRAATHQPGLLARAFRPAALGWNFIASFLPAKVSWPSLIWGIGQQPLSEATDCKQTHAA